MALGMSPAARFAGLVLVTAPIAVGGALLAVAGALLASPMMPIGLARRAEPDPGFAVDWSVVVAGSLGVLALVCAAAALGAWRIVRSGRRTVELVPPSLPRVAASRSGAGPTLATGVALAFDRRPPAIPSRSAIAGVTVAVTAVIATLDVLSQPRSAPDIARPLGLLVAAHVELLLERGRGRRYRARCRHAALTDVARWDAGFSYVNGAPVRASGSCRCAATSDFRCARDANRSRRTRSCWVRTQRASCM